MYMRITRKRLNKIRHMKKQSVRKYKKYDKKKRERTLRNRKVNLQKRSMKYKIKGGNKIQDAIRSYNNQIVNLKKRLPFLEKRQTKIKANTLSKKNELLKKRGVENIKDLPGSDRAVLKNYILLKRENQNEIDSIPVRISNLEILIQRIKRDAMNAQFINTIKKADSLKKKGLQDIKKIKTPIDSDINRGVIIPKVVTTVVKTLKDNKGKILSPGYVVNVIQDKDGVSASTATSILSNASSRKKSIIPQNQKNKNTPKIPLDTKINKSIKEVIPKVLSTTVSPPPLNTLRKVNKLLPTTVTPAPKKAVPIVKNKTLPNKKNPVKQIPMKKKPKTSIKSKSKSKTIKKSPPTPTERITKLIMNMKQKKLKKILNKLKVTNAKGDAKDLKKLIIQRYKKINANDLFKSLKGLNKRKDFSIMKRDSKIKMLSSYINLLKKKTLKKKIDARRRRSIKV